ncbi:MAG: VC0807 family protein [Candidatus Binatia bacterium]
MLVNLVCNIVLPGFILSRLSGPDSLGPVVALMVGISFPLGYGLYDLIRRRKWNFFSIVGLLSVSVTGTFALMEVDGFWFAVKEASIPALFGVAVLATLGTGKPLVRQIILNESVVDVERLETELESRGNRAEFDLLLRSATLWMSASFALSALLNFGLARVLLKSPAGTPEFTAELGHMTWLSWPVIALPMMTITAMILWRLLAGIHALTGLGMEDLLHGHQRETPDGQST